MTTIEQQLVALNLQWVWTGSAFTTVHNEFGWAVYYMDKQIWLTMVDPSTVKERQRIFNKSGNQLPDYGIKGRFVAPRILDIPATVDFLSHVITSAFPDAFARALKPALKSTLLPVSYRSNPCDCCRMDPATCEVCPDQPGGLPSKR